MVQSMIAYTLRPELNWPFLRKKFPDDVWILPISVVQLSMFSKMSRKSSVTFLLTNLCDIGNPDQFLECQQL